MTSIFKRRHVQTGTLYSQSGATPLIRTFMLVAYAVPKPDKAANLTKPVE